MNIKAKPIPRPILVTGGAGYIGSHTVLALVAAGIPAVVLDDLSTGSRDMVPEGVPFVQGNVADMALVRRTLRENQCCGIMHFAGSIIVPESVHDPLKYYRNNAEAGRALIEAALAENIKTFIFSSTASVYGRPKTVPINEDAPTAPENPYGFSKLIIERILKDVSSAHGLSYAALRYFNVAGADAKGRAGQVGPQSTHLIKIAVETVLGRRRHMEIFGDDYDTPDGACIRDYIHVSDLADAHVKAFNHLLNGGDNLILNCGYGRGASVREVLNAVQKVSGQTLDIRIAPRRPGDVPELVADVTRIRKILGWVPRFTDLDVIIRTALEWERKRA